ncbi:unnamed protein product [Thelazia callipaeda]|uniref:SCP domain-containing protein n=1 Tax=Thelazia callipaeda TaxID=103827 RepID=A0A0N5D9M8_THECL|nr:unnamed protein product [Thelazia callipaeda]
MLNKNYLYIAYLIVLFYKYKFNFMILKEFNTKFYQLIFLFNKMDEQKLFSVTVAYDVQCPGGKLTSEQRMQIVAQHNNYRSKLANGKERSKDDNFMPSARNMLKMIWSCDLERTAQQWADHCRFQHSTRQQRNNAGENIYYYQSSEDITNEAQKAALMAGEAWWSELYEFYYSNPLNDMTMNQFNPKVGHFTQMAWANTHKIGCGIAPQCSNGHKVIVVCQYKEAGNMIGSKIYEVGQPCKGNSDCATNKCSIEDGLCVKEE